PMNSSSTTPPPSIPIPHSGPDRGTPTPGHRPRPRPHYPHARRRHERADAAAGPDPRYVSRPFFFQAYGHHRYLHSFPTRRSSDLRDAGSYRYDCVGFVSYALKQAAPQAWATTTRVTGIAKGRIPTPAKYQTFFAGLAKKPQAG